MHEIFITVKAEAKVPHMAPAPKAFPNSSAIPEYVILPADTVLLSRVRVTSEHGQ